MNYAMTVQEVERRCLELPFVRAAKVSCTTVGRRNVCDLEGEFRTLDQQCLDGTLRAKTIHYAASCTHFDEYRYDTASKIEDHARHSMIQAINRLELKIRPSEGSIRWDALNIIKEWKKLLLAVSEAAVLADRGSRQFKKNEILYPGTNGELVYVDFPESLGGNLEVRIQGMPISSPPEELITLYCKLTKFLNKLGSLDDVLKTSAFWENYQPGTERDIMAREEFSFIQRVSGEMGRKATELIHKAQNRTKKWQLLCATKADEDETTRLKGYRSSITRG